jgi:hypothetical protein
MPQLGVGAKCIVFICDSRHIMHMKTRMFRRTLLSGLTCATVLLATSAIASEKAAQQRRGTVQQDDTGLPPRERVILVQVTGSLIPQRVVLNGRQVNSTAPVSMYGRNDLSRAGASTVEGILARDPSISFRR